MKTNSMGSDPTWPTSNQRKIALLPICGLSVFLLVGCLSQVGKQTANAQNAAPAAATSPVDTNTVLTGEAARGDWTTDAPGVRRHLTIADLDAPYATKSVDHGAHIIPRPEGAWPKAPAGFTVTAYATGLNNPRVLVTAPNGDIFVAESGPNRIRVLHDANGDGKPGMDNIFAEGLKQPFGIAFYPPGRNPKYVYIANTDSVVRFPYKNGDLKATGPAETIVNDISGGGRLRGGGHWTRDIAFSKDGKKMYVSVGSRSNVDEDPNNHDVELRRARIFEYNPDGTGERVYAYGIRNPVGLAINPITGELWTSVNERDALGDHLVPDYITRVQNNGFYGWPWFYIGGHQDPRHEGEHPELKDKVIVPDVLVQSHSASLDLAFYTGKQFPKEYDNDAFAAEHGSWNRDQRTGYKVIRVPQKKGVPTGEYDDFLTGFVTPQGDVWGRPVGVTIANDGALLVSDDASNTVWRVAYTGKK